MKVNQVYHGFFVIREEYIKELEATAYEMEHHKSGARLLYVAAKDDNKVFSVSFRTPPKDSTGVAHILEHSVLCGSRKFPLKEPFVELVKGSLNTFLNAMTFPDKTMYPVASRNDKDFANLMDVYLDAVFYPRVAKDPDIVRQEGWHYELESKNDDLTYKGVVYNEMKGVFSSPDSILERHMMEELFPESPYGVESGGDPEYITDLTYEDFLAFYKEYYHPSNSYIFLYGLMDINERLAFLDKEYLSAFDKIEVKSFIPFQPPFKSGIKKSFPYGISSEEREEEASLHALTYVMHGGTQEERLGFEVLTHALLTSPAAPLKELLVSKGLGKDISGYYLDSLLQPLWNVTVTGSEKNMASSIMETVLSTLQDMVNTGFDKKMLEASLNMIEFSLREADFGGRPKGLIYHIRMMDFWLYGNDPLEAVRYETPLEELREGLKGRFFEDLVTKYILQNTHYGLISIYPEKGLLEKREEEERQKLKKIKESMSDEELEDIILQTTRLKERQAEPDSEEALQSIPLLALEDLTTDVERIERREERIGKALLHFIPANANGINYVNFYFDISVLEKDEIPYVEVIAGVLGKLGTEMYTYQELGQEINTHLGGFSTQNFVVDCYEKEWPYRALLSIKVKALHNKLPKSLELVKEMIRTSRFNDTKRLKDLINEAKAIWDLEAFRRGHSLVSRRVLAQVTESDKLRDYSDLGCYELISFLSALSDIELQEVGRKISAMAEKLFRPDNLEISFVGTEEEYDAFKSSLGPVVENATSEVLPRKLPVSTKEFVNEGIITSGKVQYVAIGGDFSSHGYTYSGAMAVLETILRYEYLWLRIRVQGGAYGAFANITRNGNVVFCSYRDPNLRESLQVYREIPDFIRNFEISDRELTKYIIGTISPLEVPLTPSMRGERAMGMYFAGASWEDKVQAKKEIIGCTKDRLQGFADMIEAVLADNHICVMGNEGKIREAKELFEKIGPLPK